MSPLEVFRASLRDHRHRFSDTLAFIAGAYRYQPTAFTNGEVRNAAGENEGSCRVLALAALEGFSLEETLLAFGEHYHSVLASPDGVDHRNIRALLTTGLSAVCFERPPLSRK